MFNISVVVLYLKLRERLILRVYKHNDISATTYRRALKFLQLLKDRWGFLKCPTNPKSVKNCGLQRQKSGTEN